jgi:hypothetical protein
MLVSLFNDLYYKPLMIVNNDSRIVNKLETSLTDDASHHLRSSHVYSTGHKTGNVTDSNKTLAHYIKCTIVTPLKITPGNFSAFPLYYLTVIMVLPALARWR